MPKSMLSHRRSGPSIDAAQPGGRRADGGGDDERDQQQEPGREHQRDVDQVAAKERQPRHRPRLHVPYLVERRLQLPQHGHGANQDGADADHRADHPLSRCRVGVAHQPRYGHRARRAEQRRGLHQDLRPRLVASEHQAGDADRHQQQRRNREHRVIGQRGGHLGDAVGPPLVEGLVQEPQDGHGPGALLTHGRCLRARCGRPGSPPRPPARSHRSAWPDASGSRPSAPGGDLRCATTL